MRLERLANSSIIVWVKHQSAILVRVAFTVCACVLLLQLLSHKAYSWQSFSVLSSLHGLLLLSAALLLMPLNFALEAWKWRGMLRTHYPALTLGEAFKAVLAGQAFGFITPNRIGEYAGRVFYLAPGARAEAAVALFLSRFCQLAVTLIAGVLSLAGLWLAGRLPLISISQLVVLEGVLGAAAGVVCLIILSARVAALADRLLSKLPQGWLTRGLEVVWRMKAGFTRQQLFFLLLQGILRYCVFMLQYWLLMAAAGFQGGLLLGAALITLVFIAKAMIPSIALSELGIREGLALGIMGFFGVVPAIAFNATLVLFFVNLLLPALLGLFFIPRLYARSVPGVACAMAVK